MAVAASSDSDELHPRHKTTFASQKQLPKLPIPSLEQTCRHYIEALAPLQSPQEHQATTQAVRHFQQRDGPELQRRLQEYADHHTSYIEQFWYDSYLNFDNPVVLNLNPFFLLEDDPTPARNNQVTRAASLVVSALCFVRAVRREELPPDTNRGKPLCMYQFSRLFGTARVPTEAGCRIGQDQGAKHVVVLCRGQFYWFDALDENSDLVVGERDLALNLQAIVEDAEQTSVQDAAKSALGILTTENRKTWAGLRDFLTRVKGSNNAECLEIVDSALFVLCLDYTEPRTGADLCGNMLCGSNAVVKGVQIGTCTNRWYDKLQIIVCKNGSAGINFEHTGVDGHSVLRFASDVYTDTILRFAKSINGQAPSLWTTMSPDPTKRSAESLASLSITPHKLEWDMEPQLSTALRFAETRLADLIQQNEFETLDFDAYGKLFITSMGFSPDAFVQMAFQAAYFGLYGRVECTYEPAMTKMFLHGRTEAIRTVTPESVAFVQAFWGNHTTDHKVEMLRRATQKHTTITRQCSQGQGQDRHLYALFCLWQRAQEGKSSIEEVDVAATRDISTKPKFDMPLPTIYGDHGWDRLNTTILSTSNCGNPALRQFGFGPVCANGFGIGYIIKDESISLCASSKHRQTRRFVDAIETFLLDMRKLLRSQQRQQTSHPSTTKSEGKSQTEQHGQARPGSQSLARGRLISTASFAKREAAGLRADSSDDDDTGGYGFFDAGMLKEALKARDDATAPLVTSPTGEQIVLSHSGGVSSIRRTPFVGRKLSLSEA